MQSTQLQGWGFIFKLLVLSTLISVAIKYGGPFLPIAPTSFNAALAVTLPPFLLAGLLGWRAWQAQRRGLSS